MGVAPAVWLVVLAHGALAVSDAALVALFPKPSATVAGRRDGDLDGDGRPETAVLYETALSGRYRLGLVTYDGQGAPSLPPTGIKTVLVTAAAELAARDLTGDGVPELVLTGGLGAHAVAYQVFAARDGRLVTLLSLSDAAPTERLEADIDGDGRIEIVHPAGNHYLWSYAHRLTDWSLPVYAWDGTHFAELGWRRPTGPGAEPTERLVRYAAGHLWVLARAAAGEAERAEPGPATAGNRWVVETLAELFADQAAEHGASTEPDAPVTAAVAAVLTGDYQAAADRILALDGPESLPAGWSEPFLAVRPVIAAAFEALAELHRDPAAQFVRGLAMLAAEDTAAARMSFLRARSTLPRPERLARWVLAGLPGARLYYVGADHLLRRIDLGPDGRLVPPLVELAELGPVRSVAASPLQAAFAYVTDDGRRVMLDQAGSARLLLRGEYLYLSGTAIAPNGKSLAVDVGTSAVRDLLVVDLATGRQRARIIHAGLYAWSPDGERLAIETPRPTEPPLPWADGGTRDVCLYDLDGIQRGCLGKGDSSAVWGVERWTAAGRLEASLTRYRRDPLTGDARPVAVERYVIEPATGRALPLTQRAGGETDRELLQRRLGLAAESFEPADHAWHPRYLLYRREAPGGAGLYLLGRDAAGEPQQVGPAPGLSEPLFASWGARAGR